MRINWVLSSAVDLDPTVNIDQLKNIGSFWGSWRTWRAYSTDNVICHDANKAQELIQRQFQQNCNFYIPNSLYVTLNRPQGVRLYEGEFQHDVDHQDDLVALNLTATVSDIVLLLGFDWRAQPKNPDRLLEHRAHNYRSLVKAAIQNNPQTQWVLIDHPEDIMPELNGIENLTKDTLSNVVSMLTN